MSKALGGEKNLLVFTVAGAAEKAVFAEVVFNVEGLGGFIAEVGDLLFGVMHVRHDLEHEKAEKKQCDDDNATKQRDPKIYDFELTYQLAG